MDWNMVFNNMPLYLEGAWTTLKISVLAIIGSTIVGYFIALLRLSNNKILNGIAAAYVWVARGTPLMLILFWLYYTTPFGLTLDAFTAGMVAMIINSAPFKSEIIRGGLVSVDKKQLEAADAVGMNPIQKTFRITIPATVRLILPSYMSNCVIMLKESAQVSVITVQDLMLIVQRTYNSTYKVAETIGVCAVMYLIMTSMVMLLQYVIEHKFKYVKKGDKHD